MKNQHSSFAYLTITPSYSKESAWMKHIEYSNSLYTRVTKLITNYTLIDKYHCCFFSCKENTCSGMNVYLYSIVQLEI